MEDGRLRCHRCKVLGNTCSYETSDKPMLREMKTALLATASSSHSEVAQPPSQDPIGVIYFSGEPHLRKQYIGTRRPDISEWNQISCTTSDHEWGIAPILAVQDMASAQGATTLRLPASSSPVTTDNVLSDILTPDQTDHLLHLFASRFLPWLNLPSTDPNLGAGQHTPLLDLARCTFAARYLEDATRASVLPRTQRLLDQAVVRHMEKPVASLETVLALQMLSLWGHNCHFLADPSPSSHSFGTTELFASAVQAATEIGLNRASALYVSLREERQRNAGECSPEDQEREQKALSDAHIWLSLCNTESILTLGAGQIPSHTSRSSHDRRLVNIPTTAPATVSCARELRLGLLGEMFDVIEQGMRLPLKDPDLLQEWSDEVSEVILKMDRLDRIMAPLPILFDQETFHFYIARVLFSVAKATFLYYAQGQCRHLCPFDMEEVQFKAWHKGFSPTGVHFFAIWSQNAVASTEAVLLSAISAAKCTKGTGSFAEQDLFTAAPDRLYCMITFAATLLVMAKFWAAENVGIEFIGATDGLLTHAIQVLESSSLFPGDPAQNCARWIQKMFKAWDQRGETSQPTDNDARKRDLRSGERAEHHDGSASESASPSQVHWYPSPASTPCSGDSMSPCLSATQASLPRSPGNPQDVENLYPDDQFWKTFRISMQARAAAGTF